MQRKFPEIQKDICHRMESAPGFLAVSLILKGRPSLLLLVLSEKYSTFLHINIFSSKYV